MLSGVHDVDEREERRDRGREVSNLTTLNTQRLQSSIILFPNNKQRGNIVITKLAVSIFKMKITD